MPRTQPSVSRAAATSRRKSVAKHVDSDTNAFLRVISEFRGFGRDTVHSVVEGIPYFVNEFWTSSQRKSHSIHEVSYRACFKAQLPEFFIDRLTKPGGVVLDPFMGRGTTPVQSALMGRIALGCDINPLSVLLARPRVRPVELERVRAILDACRWKRVVRRTHDLLAFYHPKTLAQIEGMKEWLERTAPLSDKEPDAEIDWIRMVAISRLSGHSSGFFSGRSMPPNQAVSVVAQERINARLGVSPPERDIKSIIVKKSAALLRDGAPNEAPGFKLWTGPADRLAGLEDSSVDLVVTSPPFLDVVQYAQDNWLRCWFAGVDAGSVDIAMHRSESDWAAMVHRVLAELARVLKRGGHIAFEVGEVRGGSVLLERLVWDAGLGLPLDRVAVVVNDQKFTKTSNCWGVLNGDKGTNTNRIVLLRKRG